ncbi:PREDICTED: uncharacterized protein LOC105361096 [Ceratosolen solmsi marchali]|uniref:Uncharacterized protein LOC105361096 n=1 Tax=Ceratosolen solmsi marchali TaxID=326594 RepID=A0AAJ6YEE3_9HYME|nr:PREDICTED: uncharacterized protein LOC105361096 [Ceratosolen solmsi marchali]
MNSLLRTVNSVSNRKNMLVRESLQQQLNSTVIEIQGAAGLPNSSALKVGDEALSICSAFEAIFLHGLKDSLLNRVTEVISGPDYDAMPQPSFWGPLLVFSHREIIDQIQSFSQLTTEVGYCRAWIRLALNEGLLSSYLAAIRRDNSALKPYYSRAAFIRDADLLEVAQRLIESIDYIHFDLVMNSSLLNYWSNTPLLMAAIWSPPMKSCPIFSAVDIAKTINSERADNENSLDEIETASSIGSFSSFSSSQNNLNGFSEDDSLRVLLAKKLHHLDVADIETALSAQASFSSNKDTEVNRTTVMEVEAVKYIPRESSHEKSKDNKEEESNDNVAIAATSTTVGHSLIGKLGWSTSNEDCESSMTSSIISKNSVGDCPQTSIEGPTYDALLKSYHTGSHDTPNLEDLLAIYPVYEPVTSAIMDNAEPHERRSFDEQLGILAREKGLDLQNYNCLECGQLIGLTFSKANVCCFSGDYFCCNCMAVEEHLIPSRVIHNWDLKQYPVCIKVAKYLTECSTLLDLKLINPKIYSAVDCMAQLQTLRVQLNLLRAYLFTCREPIIESFQKKVTPRDYLYEHVHQYSVSDLADIPNGTLAQHLQKVVEFARNHVLNCWLCSQKGFICEVCSNPKVIYPFDTQFTYRCGSCNAVFHSNCLNAKKPCPKCERKRKRMDLPLLNMESPDICSEATLSPTIATT